LMTENKPAPPCNNVFEERYSLLVICYLYSEALRFL
jgi:hypothetical protein